MPGGDMKMPERLKILFLCTGNSCRSQMAEGFCRHYHAGTIEAFSCGTEKHGLNPLAVKVMHESDIDISSHRSKTLDELGEHEFDYVVTVCGHANEACPVFTGKTNLIHRGFDDPPKLAANSTDENQALAHYRRVRDEIRDYILTLPDGLGRL
jgi:arsenate reductase